MITVASFLPYKMAVGIDACLVPGVYICSPVDRGSATAQVLGVSRTTAVSGEAMDLCMSEVWCFWS